MRKSAKKSNHKQHNLMNFLNHTLGFWIRTQHFLKKAQYISF